MYNIYADGEDSGQTVCSCKLTPKPLEAAQMYLKLEDNFDINIMR